jgi:jumonji domain-containing protein 2
VVPSKGWKATSKPLENIDDIVIPGPIEQNAFGRGGCYECVHISCKTMKLA